jgi:hypothetical protein
MARILAGGDAIDAAPGFGARPTPRREGGIAAFCRGYPGHRFASTKPFRSIARKLRLSVSTVHTARQHLANKILDFMGLGILVQIQHRPQWQQDIQAIREQMACGEERKH